jgi:hypothetical protein
MGDNPDYILFTQESLFALLRDLDVTRGSLLSREKQVEKILEKIDEHRVHYAAIQVFSPEEVPAIPAVKQDEAAIRALTERQWEVLRGM